ncbi:MAG: ABC transporter permease [Planctomycetes bacterium]|nr:ABC transporter permease [Planctomycetota bacterium]
MNTLLTLAHKDLLVLLRDRVSLIWMFAFPLVFAAFFGAVFGGGGPGKSNPLKVCAVAEGLTDSGRRLLDRLDASDAVTVDVMPREQAQDAVRRGERLAFLDLVRVPDDDFGMFSGSQPQIEIGIDPSRQAEKGLLQGLLMEAVFAGFREILTDPGKSRDQLRNSRARIEADPDVPIMQKLALTTFFGAFEKFLDTPGMTLGGGNGGAPAMQPQITTVAVTRERRGPPNAYSISFPQSVLWAILGCACGFAISLVRERTTGTMVRLLTAPIGQGAILAGKALACGLSCCGVTALLLTVGAVAFGVRVGNLPLLLLATLCTAACFSGLTMLLASLGRTEQAVAGLSWGVLLLSAMLGGGMVPQIAMPAWMLEVGAISPARWAITALEGAIWRDFSLAEMALPCGVLVAIGLMTGWLGSRRLSAAR